MSQTPHVRLAFGRQDGRLIALDPRADERTHRDGLDPRPARTGSVTDQTPRPTS